MKVLKLSQSSAPPYSPLRGVFPGMAYFKRALDLPQRSVDMPLLFKVQNHPFLTTIPSHSKRSMYVGYMKTGPASMKDYLKFEKKLKCPEGTIWEWRVQGT